MLVYNIYIYTQLCNKKNNISIVGKGMPPPPSSLSHFNSPIKPPVGAGPYKMSPNRAN